MSKIIDIQCRECSATNTRAYGWIDPSKFSDPTDASLLSTFFCVKCHSGNTLKLKFLPSEDLEIQEVLDYVDIKSTLSSDAYLKKQEEENTEELKISLDQI